MYVRDSTKISNFSCWIITSQFCHEIFSLSSPQSCAFLGEPIKIKSTEYARYREN